MLAPSDLGGRGPSLVRVGGRVVDGGAGWLELADAVRSVRVLGSGLEATPGDLVVVAGRFHRGAVAGARVVERHPCPEPRGDGEFARLAFEGVGARLASRGAVLRALRAHLQAEGFVEIESPLRVSAPGVDAHVDALRAEGGYLVTSPELSLKRLLVGGLPRIFQLSRVFRADELGPLHEPEFTLLEWYRAFAGVEAVLRDTEELVSRAARAVRGRAELVLPGGRTLDAKPPFARLTVQEAFRRFAKIRDAVDLAASDENRFFELLVGRVEPALAKLDRPVFLTDYPITQAALARPAPGRPEVAERFELYVGGVELSNGYGELTDPAEQARRFAAERARRRREGRRVYPTNRRFLAALAEGMPPSGGNALGVDRLVLLCTGAASIADVTAFPWSRG